ncbi:MAG: lipopolysaccharide biosynthesis protein [Ruminococcus sp.]|nr:lipopolysaccharide biosynthesis protein [Ruminococcus sp.]
MANLDERNVNVTIKNESDEKDEVVISLSGIFKKLRKYFLLWLVTAVVIGGFVFGLNAFTIIRNKPALTALISFNYNGVEQGLDPAGGVLDVNTVKNPNVISAALATLGIYDEYASEVEAIRAGIKVIPVTPSDAIDRMTVYQSVMDKATSGNLAAAQALLDTTYYPTQYKVQFSYAETSLSGDKAVEVFNQILESYRDYFYGQYGYNAAVGTSVTVVDYNDYDYAEAVDVFSTTLNALQTYVKQLSVEESKYYSVSNNGTNNFTSHFRSNTTGYTFADLSEAIKTVNDIDLDRISSVITVNNLTKNKADTIAYYEYRIQQLTRQQTQYTEVLATIQDAIASYEKDTIVVFNGTTDDGSMTSTLASDEYNKLIDQRITTQTNLSSTTQQIAFYTERKTALEKSNSSNDPARIEQLETQFADLHTKVVDLVDSVNATANEYYEKVAFANAYSILVPAVNSGTAAFATIVKASLTPIILAEALLLLAYLALAFITAIIAENKKKPEPAMASASENSEDAAEESEEAPAEGKADDKAEDKKQNNNSNNSGKNKKK